MTEESSTASTTVFPCEVERTCVDGVEWGACSSGGGSPVPEDEGEREPDVEEEEATVSDAASALLMTE